MNLFFRLAALPLALAPLSAAAVNVHALYTAACQREIGIILDVTTRQVKVLNLNGRIATVERYDVIYDASYPLDVVPISEVKNPEDVPLVEIQTQQGHGLETLVRGWPVDFSQDKISFLDLRGSEVVIDRTSIWQVIFDQESQAVRFTSHPENRYEFAHPYAFSFCPAKKGKDVLQVYPQQLLSDPVTIKREFDRLQAGHEKIRKYKSAQQFYAVPEIYGNETALGLWLQSGDRYGATANRKNNFTPLLTNYFSSGPFGFQSEFRTGSGPLAHSYHEENQTQVYYRMKADYFHFTGMVDPSLLLVGAKYNWQKSDLDQHDVRAAETASLEFGFDYGAFAVEFGVGGVSNAGAREGDAFHQANFSASSIGIRYQTHAFLFNLFGGGGGSNGFTLGYLRANTEWSDSTHRFMLSLIKRSLSFDGSDWDTGTAFASKADVWAGAIYGYWRVKTRYWLGGMLGIERLNEMYGADLSQSQIHYFPKAGAMISLTF